MATILPSFLAALPILLLPSVLGAIFLWFAFDVWGSPKGVKRTMPARELFCLVLDPVYLYALFAILVVEGAMNRLLA